MLCVYAVEFIQVLYPHKFKHWIFIDCVQMRCFTMLACPGLMFWDCTSRFHTIYVYTSDFIQLLYPYQFKNCLFLKCVCECGALLFLHVQGSWVGSVLEDSILYAGILLMLSKHYIPTNIFKHCMPTNGGGRLTMLQYLIYFALTILYSV